MHDLIFKDEGTDDPYNTWHADWHKKSEENY